MQEQANAAASSYTAGKAANRTGPHPDDAMEKEVKGVDTEQLKAPEN